MASDKELINEDEKRAIMAQEAIEAGAVELEAKASGDVGAVEPPPPSAPAPAESRGGDIGRKAAALEPIPPVIPPPNSLAKRADDGGAPGIHGEDWPPPPPPRAAPRSQALAPFESAPVAIVETATSAAAAQAKAATEARYVVAWRNPRSLDNVRAALLHECKRPSFAKVARYKLPRGKSTIVGPSIRFAEAAMRCMGNMLPETFLTYDDEDKRIYRVAVTDLETNVTYTRDIVVTKLVERRTLRRGQEAVSQRVNADGVITYTVRASEDDLLNKEGAAVSKAMRTCALRLIPGDVVDEAMELCRSVADNAAAKDPDAARKELSDGFAELNVTPKDLEAYLGHDLGKCSPAQLLELRGLYAAVRDGETSWAAIVEELGGDAPAKPGKGAAGLKAALK